MKFSEVKPNEIFSVDGEFRRKTGAMNYVIVGSEILGDLQEINLKREVEVVHIQGQPEVNKVAAPPAAPTREVRLEVAARRLNTRSTDEALTRLDEKVYELEGKIARSKEVQLLLYTGLLPGSSAGKVRKAAEMALAQLNDAFGEVSGKRVASVNSTGKKSGEKTSAKKTTRKAVKRSK